MIFFFHIFFFFRLFVSLFVYLSPLLSLSVCVFCLNCWNQYFMNTRVCRQIECFNYTSHLLLLPLLMLVAAVWRCRCCAIAPNKRDRCMKIGSSTYLHREKHGLLFATLLRYLIFEAEFQHTQFISFDFPFNFRVKTISNIQPKF